KTGHLFGRAHSADWLIGRQLVEHLAFAASVVARDELIDERRVDARGTNAVAPDVLLHVVDGNRHGHRMDGAFGQSPAPSDAAVRSRSRPRSAAPSRGRCSPSRTPAGTSPA